MVALIRIVAGLVGILAAQGGASRWPLPVYGMILRVLLPAESAVRRLIVMAARGLDVPVLPSRPMRKGQVIARKRGGRRSFQLFDRRKRFGDPDAKPGPRSMPRIRFVDALSPREQFLAKFAKPPYRRADGLCRDVEAQRVSRRIEILKAALDNLPRQAMRMARWLKRRAALEQPVFTSPLRPGPAPGHVKKPREEIDHILTDCHVLAWHALRRDTS